MNLGLVVPGGVDPSGEERTIPVLRALIARLARRHDVRVIALHQPAPTRAWELDGARVLACRRPSSVSAARILLTQHRNQPFDLLHAFWASTGGTVAAWVGAHRRIPVLLHVAGGELVRLDGIAYGGGRSWRGRWMARYALRHAALVTGATAPICLAASRLAPRVERVPLGVDLGRWPVCPPRPRGDGPLRLAWVGSINRVKGPEVLLAVLAELVRRGVAFTADIIGEDTLLGAIQQRVGAMGLGAQVRFRGFLRQAELHARLRGMDVLLHTAWHEAGPVVVPEAALVGVPTIGTAVGHVAEWAPGAAVAVPVGDAGALAAAVSTLAADDARRLDLATAAQGRALAMTADWTADRFQELYAEVVAT